MGFTTRQSLTADLMNKSRKALGGLHAE